MIRASGMVTPAQGFLIWVGSKRSALPRIVPFLPPELPAGQITRYAEPFLGAGWMFFYLIFWYEFEAVFLSDLNPDLILTYITIRDAVDELIERVRGIERELFSCSDRAGRKKLFIKTRGEYNWARRGFDYSRFGASWVERAAQFVFLNRRSYRGKYQVNKQGNFCSCFLDRGRQGKAPLVKPPNLYAVSDALAGVELRSGDFTLCRDFVNDHTFVYLDPPYLGFKKHKCGVLYAYRLFDESEQLRVARYFRLLDGLGARLMLSNADTFPVGPEGNFFDVIYSDFRIERVMIRQSFNASVGEDYPPEPELLIMNYGL